jgi:hypothetical protein
VVARGGQLDGEVAQGEPPGGVVAAEELGDVLARNLGELRAPFVRRHDAVRAHGAEQGAGECP